MLAARHGAVILLPRGDLAGDFIAIVTRSLFSYAIAMARHRACVALCGTELEEFRRRHRIGGFSTTAPSRRIVDSQQGMTSPQHAESRFLSSQHPLSMAFPARLGSIIESSSCTSVVFLVRSGAPTKENKHLIGVVVWGKQACSPYCGREGRVPRSGIQYVGRETRHANSASRQADGTDSHRGYCAV